MPDKLSYKDRILLISKWSEWFYDATSSWHPDITNELGMELAYLFAAMAKGTVIEVSESSELLKCLRGQDGYGVEEDPVTEKSDIWQFITILKETG